MATLKPHNHFRLLALATLYRKMEFSCDVPGCGSKKLEGENSLLSWHSLPAEERLRNNWLSSSRLSDPQSRGKNEQEVVICSLHFKPSEYLFKDQLKPNAVPSRFPWFDNWLKSAIHLSDAHGYLVPSETKILVSKMDDDEIEVIEEVNIFKRKPTPPSPLPCPPVDSKKPRMDNKFAKKLVGTLNQPIFISINTGKPSDSLVSEENQAHFMRRINETQSFLLKLKDNLNKTLERKTICDDLVRRAKYLISFDLSNLNTSRSARPLPSPTTNNAPSTIIDGLQIVNMVARRSESNLPPSGSIKKKEPEMNAKVYGMKTDLFGIWSKGVIISIKEGTEKLYRVRFDNSNKTLHRTLTAKQIAHRDPCEVRIPFGKRIIALYKPEDKESKPVMYAGIIAEPPKSTNLFRYLIFFDDGFAQYIDHSGIRLVYEESNKVWEDIHPDNKEFIKGYCDQFPERPMLKLQKNQVIKTEYNSGWWYARVVDIDASMVRMYFEMEKRFEWIYRGSTRLAPLFSELEKAKQNRLTGRVRRHMGASRKMDENQPYVEYTRNEDEIVLSDGSDSESKKVSPEKPVRRNVARKSTAQTKLPLPLPNVRPEERKDEGELYFMKLPNFKRIIHIPHQCSRACREKEPLISLKTENPLRIPMYLGWERQSKSFRQRGSMIVINYRAPCGRTLRSIVEVNCYLFLVESQLTIDFFSFDPQLCPFQTFKTNPEEAKWFSKDITKNKENVPIECVNCLTDEGPLDVEYATKRYTAKNVVLNLDKEFLCGCDCKDNCQDPIACQCRQLTIKAHSKDGNNTDVGYNFRRLSEPIVTGIYECNSRCKCSSSCMNRVVQNGLQIRLQMFRTVRKGWGIRCLDDVAAGMFLCIYAGQLLTDSEADENGRRFGDEYMAALDHIEIAEQQKEGYESDVSDIEMENKEDYKPKNGYKQSDKSDDDDDSVSSSSKSISSSELNDGNSDADPEYEPQIEDGPSSVSNYATRSKNKLEQSADLSSINSDDSLNIIDMDISFSKKKNAVESKNYKHTGVNAKKSTKLPLSPPPLPKKVKKFKPTRSYFGEDNYYSMDAKSKGNIGRYLNHSCHPNSFVQNIFVDTHDLRFPTVAFFASERIKAGTELTWDYSYEVGSVVNKVLYCYCDSRNCRGRLL